MSEPQDETSADPESLEALADLLRQREMTPAEHDDYRRGVDRLRLAGFDPREVVEFVALFNRLHPAPPADLTPPEPDRKAKRKARNEKIGRFLGQVGAGFLKRFLGS